MASLEGFNRLFLDASFLVVLFGPGDAMHDRAIELIEEADQIGARLRSIRECVGEALRCRAGISA